MSSNVEVPALGESISEAVLVRWYKHEGDRVAVDEPICELESDKATVDLPAPVGGVLHPVKPMTTILIKPGCRHRIIGQIKFVNVPVPAFDPHDEWFD